MREVTQIRYHLQKNRKKFTLHGIVFVNVSWYCSEEKDLTYPVAKNQKYYTIVSSVCCCPVSLRHQDISSHGINTLGLRQNSHHFRVNIFKCIFLNENVRISIEISLKFVPKGPINNIVGLFQIMTALTRGKAIISEPMMGRVLTHICVTRPQWVNYAGLMYHCVP